MERFQRTILDEFFRVTFRTTLYETVEALEVDLDAWLEYFNYELPHQGYCNRGNRPIDTINEFFMSKDAVKEET